MSRPSHICIVGVSSYLQEEITPLPAAQSDAIKLGHALKNWGIPESHITYFINEEATQENIESYFASLKNEGAPFDLVFYFCGHGFRTISTDPHSYLLMHDSSTEGGACSKGLSLDQLTRMANQTEATHTYFFIDACYLRVNHISHPMLNHESDGPNIAQKGVFYLLSSGLEPSFEDVDHQYGYFTDTLLNTISQFRQGPVPISTFTDSINRQLSALNLPLPETYAIGIQKIGFLPKRQVKEWSGNIAHVIEQIPLSHRLEIERAMGSICACGVVLDLNLFMEAFSLSQTSIAFLLEMELIEQLNDYWVAQDVLFDIVEQEKLESAPSTVLGYWSHQLEMRKDHLHGNRAFILAVKAFGYEPQIEACLEEALSQLYQQGGSKNIDYFKDAVDIFLAHPVVSPSSLKLCEILKELHLHELAEKVGESLVKESVFWGKRELLLLMVPLMLLFIFLWGGENQVVHVKNVHKDFTGRSQYLSKIAQYSFKKVGKKQLPIVGLWGQGGVGKSELAIAFTNFYKDKFSFIWWVECENSTSYDQNYKEMARQLGVSFGGKELPKVIRQRVHHYLENYPFKKPWLLVYDNVDHPLELPQRGRGAIVLTSRNQEVTRPYYSVKVEPFSPQESVELLQKIIGKKPIDAEQIGKELGHIPLLLNQAAHYIEKNQGINGRTYLDIFTQNRQNFVVEPTLDVRYDHRDLISSWEVTSNYLAKECPDSLDWLYLAAYFSADVIPVKWVEKWLAFSKGETNDSKCKMRANRILTTLRDFAIIRDNPEQDTFSIHRLRQEILRSLDPSPQMRKRAGLHFLASLVKGQGVEEVEVLENNRELWDEIYQWELNATVLLSSLEKSDQQEVIADLCDVICSNQLVRGDFTHVVEWRQRALASRSHLKSSSKEVLTSVDRLCWALCRDGRYFDAEKLFRESLEKRIKMFGKDNIYVATSLHGIGYCLERRGQYKESVKYEEKALKLREKFLDPIDPELAYSVDALAWVLERVGRYEEAQKYARRGLSIRRALYGEKHSTVASSKHHLAWVLQSMGHYDESEAIHREALQIRNEIFGKNHPSTVNSIQYLAWVLGEAGKYRLVEDYYRDVIEIRNNLLSPNHPETVRTYIDLAWALRKQRKYEEAKKCYLHVILAEEKRDGGNHYEIATAKFGLARVYVKEGKYKEALSLHNEVVQMRKEIFGDDDLDYYVTNGHLLPEILANMGKLDEALALHEKALLVRIDRLGCQHPAVYTSMEHIANTYVMHGEYEKAKDLYVKVLNQRQKKFGHDHLLTASTQRHLSFTLAHLGNKDESIELIKKALKIEKEVYGNYGFITTTYDDLGRIFNERARKRGKANKVPTRYLGAENLLNFEIFKILKNIA